jgi:F-type H+-transporting ATPase subunit delta
MAKLITIYGKAFFELALAENAIDQYEKEAKMVVETYQLNEAFNKIIRHPDVSESKKFNMLKELFANKVNPNFIGFFNLLITKRRENFLVEILENFLQKALEHKGIMQAKVITAIELTDEQVAKITSQLIKKFNKKVILEQEIDKSLIAGLKIIAGGYVIDASFSKQLADLKTYLYAAEIDESVA